MANPSAGRNPRIDTITYSQRLVPEDRDLRLVLLREIPEDENLRQQWDALAESADQPQIFYTWEWAMAMQRAYRAVLHPLVFLAYEDQDRLCGVGALASDSESGQVSFLCATTSDYCDFLSLPERKPALVAGVLAELRRQGFGDAILTNLPADSDTVSALRRAAAGTGYCCFARTAYLCAQVMLSQLERRPGDNRLVLPRGKMLRRFSNAMGREAPVRLDHARSWDSAGPLVQPFVHAHVARFLVTGRISNVAHPERRVFLEELAKLLAERGWLALTRMMSGNDVFAWNYGFQFQRTWFWYQPTFDSVLEKYSPGFCLLAKLVEEAAGKPELSLVDLGLGAEEYKDRFSNQTRQTLCVTLHTSAVRHYLGILRYHASEIIRKWPKAEAVARSTEQRWRTLQEHIRQDGVRATFSSVGKRFLDLLWSKTEVYFYEWSGSAPVNVGTLNVQLLGLKELAGATMQYVGDQATLTYLLRAATRVHKEHTKGFGLVNDKGDLLHFAWVTAFDGFFLSELNTKVDAPSPDCVMLFDCWTPPSARGHGYYGQCAALVAKLMQESGKKPWIFSAASNVASVRGLEKSGFERRYSLVRQRLMWWQKIASKAPVSSAAPTAEASARV